MASGEKRLYVFPILPSVQIPNGLCFSLEGKQVKALLQGPRYAKSLDDKIKDVQKQSSSLQRRVDRLTQKQIVATASTTERTRIDVQGLRSTANTIKAHTNATRVDIAEIKQSNEEGVKAMNTLASLLAEQSRQAECKSYQNLKCGRDNVVFFSPFA